MTQKGGTSSNKSVRIEVMRSITHEMESMQRSLAEIETVIANSPPQSPIAALSSSKTLDTIRSGGSASRVDCNRDIASASWPPAQQPGSVLSVSESSSDGSEEHSTDGSTSEGSDEDAAPPSKLQRAAQETIQKSSKLGSKGSTIAVQKANSTLDKPPNSPTSRKEYLIRLISLKSSDQKQQMPLKSASMDNVHLRNSKPLKPILKKPFNMQQRLLLNLEFQYGENFGGSTSALPETTASDWAAEYNGDISRQNSHNDLPIVDNGSSIRRLGSTRSISFSMDEVPVIETYSKTAYNRKPDNNITVKKLTPKLKQEIREELNDFKKNEMEVHELSASNTAFH